MSYVSPKTGESVNIYKAENYSAEHPMYIIKGLDAGGNEFEEAVDASEIDPNNCSFNELIVLNVETGHTSPNDYLRSVAVRDKANCGSCFEKADYISYAQAVMEDYKTLGNWESYLAMDKWVQSIKRHFVRHQKTEITVDYTEILKEKINEIYIKIKNGDTEPAYQIGAQSFTEKEWKKFIDTFDSIEEAVQELMKEEQARKEAEEGLKATHDDVD